MGGVALRLHSAHEVGFEAFTLILDALRAAAALQIRQFVVSFLGHEVHAVVVLHVLIHLREVPGMHEYGVNLRRSNDSKTRVYVPDFRTCLLSVMTERRPVVFKQPMAPKNLSG